MNAFKIALRCALAALGACGGQATWAASFATYTNEATFLTATGATSATGALPSPGGQGTYSSAQSATSVGSVTFSAGRWFFTEWTTVLPGAEIGISDGAGSVNGVVNDGLNADFAAPVYSAGFRFYEPQAGTGVIDGCNVAPCTDSTFTVQVVAGNTVLGTLAMPTPVDQAVFFGVWSDTPFTGLRIRETAGTDDNEFYGQFFTGTTAPVPEPAGTWLLAAGLAAIGVLTARRRRPC